MAFLIEEPGYFVKKEEYEKEHQQSLLNEEEIKQQAEELYKEYLSKSGINVVFTFKSLNQIRSSKNILIPLTYFGNKDNVEFDNKVMSKVIDYIFKEINEHYKDWINDVHAEYKEIEYRFEKVAKKTIKTNILLFTILPLAMIAGILIGSLIF